MWNSGAKRLTMQLQLSEGITWVHVLGWVQTCNVTAYRNTVSWQCGRDSWPRNVSKVGYAVTLRACSACCRYLAVASRGWYGYGLSRCGRATWRIALPFLDHGTRRGWGVSVTPRPLFTPPERPGTHCTGDWVGPRAGLDRIGKSRPHRDSIPGPSSPWPVVIPTELSRPTVFLISSQQKPMCYINPLNPELNPICYLLALLGAHHFLHVNRIRVKSLTLRRLMSYIYIYIYGAPILDVSRSHTTTQHSR